MPLGLESAKKKSALFDFSSSMKIQSGSDTNRSMKIQSGSDTNRSAASQRSSFSKTKPLPPISMQSVKPTANVTNGLRRLKEDVLDNSLTILKALKLKAPGGTCPPDLFFDTLQDAGVHCREEEVIHIMKTLTDQKTQIRYPLFFQTFAEMKDHHEETYADGYFHDGSFEQWKSQQQGTVHAS